MEFRTVLIQSPCKLTYKDGSVYCKLVMSLLAGELVKDKVKKIKPRDGIIQAMIITEKQYADIEYLLGGPQTEKVDGTDRLVIF